MLLRLRLRSPNFDSPILLQSCPARPPQGYCERQTRRLSQVQTNGAGWGALRRSEELERVESGFAIHVYLRARNTRGEQPSYQWESLRLASPCGGRKT